MATPDETLVGYNPDWYQGLDEALVPYYQRLSKDRPTGILGGMQNEAWLEWLKKLKGMGVGDESLDQISAMSGAPLGQMVFNSGGGSQGDSLQKPSNWLDKPSLEDAVRARAGMDRSPADNLFAVGGLLGGPIGLVAGIGGAVERGKENYVINKAIDDLLESGEINNRQAMMLEQSPEMLTQYLYKGKLGEAQSGLKKDFNASHLGGLTGGGISGMFEDILGGNQTMTDKMIALKNNFALTQPENIMRAQLMNPAYAGYGAASYPVDDNSFSQGDWGFSNYGDIYRSSYGGDYALNKISSNAQRGLNAVQQGMFDTPSWYSDDYAEPSYSSGGDYNSDSSVTSYSTSSNPAGSGWSAGRSADYGY